MKRRTKMSAALAATAAMLAVAACSPTTSGSGGEVELDFAIFSPDQQPVIQEVVDLFEEQNPGINVTLRVIPWVEYWNTLQTTAAGGTGPDVAWMLGARLGPYIEADALLPLDDAIDAAGIDISNYPAQMVEFFQHEGRTLALPKDVGTIGLWYNRAIFDAAGVDYPTADWTWDDVKETARKLTDADNGVFGFAAPLDPEASYYNTIPQAGGYVISEDGTRSGFDSPEAIAGLEFWTYFIQEGLSPDLASFADVDAVTQFMSGHIGMIYTGSFFAIRFANDEFASANFDVAPLPSGPSSNTSSMNSIGNVAFRNSEHPEEAAKLAAFLSGPEASRIQSDSGIVIGSYAGTQQGFVDAFPQFNAQVFLDAIEGATAFPTSLHTERWASREHEFLTPAWTGEVSMEEAARSLAEVMNAALAEEQG